MDRLTHTIDYAISLKIWNPIRLNKRGPNLSHLFFADDLILFAEENLEQIKAMQAWDDLCKPKNVGGLGLRKAKFMNQSLLVKVGWGLINKRDSLWTRTLRSKYGCGEDIIPIVRRRKLNSNLWSDICKI